MPRGRRRESYYTAVGETRVRETRSSAVITACIGAGLALRVWQYASDVSLWFDEISIARNLTERSLGVLLTRPLGYTQIAPVGFMAAEKLATLLIGTSDLALRTFPFLWGIAALLLFPRVAARIVDGAALTVSVALFAFAPPLVRYSTEVKQYGADVVVALVLLALTLDLRKQPTTRRCAVTGALGFVFIWFSQASVLVMGGLCGALVVLWLLD